jgi:hypothetical protein
MVDSNGLIGAELTVRAHYQVYGCMDPVQLIKHPRSKPILGTMLDSSFMPAGRAAGRCMCSLLILQCSTCTLVRIKNETSP